MGSRRYNPRENLERLATQGRSLRIASHERQTLETSVRVILNLDGTGDYDIESGIGFLDHMLAQLSRHGMFDIELRAEGDLEVDAHHTVEDVAICLGASV